VRVCVCMETGGCCDRARWMQAQWTQAVDCVVGDTDEGRKGFSHIGSPLHRPLSTRCRRQTTAGNVSILAAYATSMTSVRLSVCLSATLVDCDHMTQYTNRRTDGPPALLIVPRTHNNQIKSNQIYLRQE